MKPRYHFLFVALCSLGLTSAVSAQNREVSSTDDANGVYAQQAGPVNGKVFYTEVGNSGLTIYYCDETTGFDGGVGAFSCATGDGTTGLWIIASQPYGGVTTSSNTILYYSEQPEVNPEAPLGTYLPFNGVSLSGATVTDTALPVELTSFEAVTSGQRVQLRWATASETNNAGFSVEMKQGEAFVARGFVAGNGTTLEAQRYAFDAGELAPGRYTFRLKQVDFDGAFEYSPEVEVAVTLSEAFHFSAPQPNPMRSAARFSITTQQAQPVTVRVYDMLGRAVDTIYDGAMAAGETRTFTLDRGNLPAGLYLIQLQGTHVQSTRQVTLL